MSDVLLQMSTTQSLLKRLFTPVQLPNPHCHRRTAGPHVANLGDGLQLQGAVGRTEHSVADSQQGVETLTKYESNFVTKCKIRGFRGGDYEEWRLLGCYAVWLL
jgi:hypothetical protein